MGRQINYYMDHKSFLTVAQAAIDMGLIIIPVDCQSPGGCMGLGIRAVTPEVNMYRFYVPMAGSLPEEGIYLSGNCIIEAGYSHISHGEKTIGRARIYSASGEYDGECKLISRPECTARAYNALCRAVKRAAPLTNFRAANVYFTQKWGHSVVCDRREYISPFCCSLTEEGYEIFG